MATSGSGLVAVVYAPGTLDTVIQRNAVLRFDAVERERRSIQD
jgi:hypothetical protein